MTDLDDGFQDAAAVARRRDHARAGRFCRGVGVPPRRGGRRLRGLDGLRAVAVMSVVLFHLDFSLAPGGFLGVDVFFVISGFLITNLLAKELLESGRLRLGQFYLRRARRLLPTVLVLLAVVIAASTTVWRDQLPTLRGGVLSSLGYVTNWWLIADHQSYFVAAGRPSMLQHLWSLAIEEQFYLIWSVVVLLVAGTVLVPRRQMTPERRLRVVVWVAIALAGVSTLVMAVLANHEDLPYGASVSRVYFGSDTHTMGLFVGSAAGALLALNQHRPPSQHPRPRLLGLTDLGGAVLVAVVIYEFFGVNEFSPRLYRGGFLAFDLAVLFVISCAVRRGSFLGRVLDMRPIRWIGQRSYSIYIWHWPIVVVTRPGLDVSGPTLLINVGRLALILGAAALSYRYVEVPLRSGMFTGRRDDRPTRAVRAGELGTLALTLLVATVLPLVTKPITDTPASGSGHGPAVATGTVGVSPTPQSHKQPGRHRQARSGRPRSAGHRTTTAARPRLSAFGDSVLLGAAPALRARVHHLNLDAVEGRQAFDVLTDVGHDAEAGRLAADVLIDVGNNGVISPAQLDATLRLLADRHRVVVMNDRVPREWQDVNNHTISSLRGRFSNVRVIDWHGRSAGKPTWFYSDGLHLTPRGAAAYAAMVVRALAG